MHSQQEQRNQPSAPPGVFLLPSTEECDFRKKLQIGQGTARIRPQGKRADVQGLRQSGCLVRAPLVSSYCICPSQFPLREATKRGQDYLLPKLPNSNPAFNLKPGWNLGSGLAQSDILRVTRAVREGCWRWTDAQHCCQMWVWHLLTRQPP